MIPRLLNGWQDANDSEITPLSEYAHEKIIEQGGERYTNLLYCMAYQKGKEFIVVTEDGGYFKVDAVYSMWFDGGMFCAWSYEHLITMVEAKMQGLPIPRDPDYQS